MSERFELPAELTIYGAMETRDALLAWVKAQAPQASTVLNLSARRVESVDGSGLQLLAALSSMGISWQLVETSQVFADGCKTLGLADWLSGTVRPSVSA